MAYKYSVFQYTWDQQKQNQGYQALINKIMKEVVGTDQFHKIKKCQCPTKQIKWAYWTSGKEENEHENSTED